MDNKKISIDELFRQRPGDRPVAPPPGAWSRMEGLLDAKMPVGVAPAVARRPSRGWAFLLLGVLVVGSGSFIYNQAHQSKTPVVGNANTVVNTTAPFGTPVQTSAAKPLAKTVSTPPKLSKKTPENSRAIAAVTPKKGQPVSGKIEATPAISGNQTAPSQSVRPHSVETPVVKQSESKALAGLNLSPKTPAPIAPATPVAIPEISPNPAPVIVHEAVAPLTAAVSRLNAFFSGKVVNPMAASRVEAYLAQWAAGPDAHPKAQGWSAKTPNGSLVAQGNAQKEAPAQSAIIPENPQTGIAPSQTPIVAQAPAAQSPVIVTTAATPEQKIEAAIEDLQQARFSFGLLAGINSSLGGGSGALQGLHAGMMGILALSEKWSLGAELRYAFRLNNSMDLKDDYYSGKVINEATISRNGKAYNAVRYEIDSMLSRYSFPSYQSLELPLQVRYNHNRFSFYGGPSVAFHFAPAVTKTNTRIGTISRFDTLDAALPLPTLPSRASDVTTDDFGSRFSLGYNVGAQYRIMPALHLDLRLSQALWDNQQGRSAGSRRVSETYLHIPSVQLSVGYFWSEKSSKKEKPEK